MLSKADKDRVKLEYPDTFENLLHLAELDPEIAEFLRMTQEERDRARQARLDSEMESMRIIVDDDRDLEEEI